jgi:hypothetical protein
MRLIKYDGKLYELVFLNTDSSLSEDSRTDICIAAIEMEHRGISIKRIKGDEFEGMIKRGQQGVVGSYFGTSYCAKIETEKGKRSLDVLVSEKRSFESYN